MTIKNVQIPFANNQTVYSIWNCESLINRDLKNFHRFIRKMISSESSDSRFSLITSYFGRISSSDFVEKKLTPQTLDLRMKASYVSNEKRAGTGPRI